MHQDAFPVRGIVPVLPMPDSSLSPLSVLLVDDCAFQRILTTSLLAQWGIVPLVATGGCEAISLEQTQDFDIILMDIEMPDLDGFETTRLIREAQRLRPHPVHPPVVAYTSSKMPIAAKLMEFVGIDDVIAKPCDAGTMSRCLQRWCSDKFLPSGGPLHGLETPSPVA
jgi:CheY-like chemotaxis protein